MLLSCEENQRHVSLYVVFLKKMRLPQQNHILVVHLRSVRHLQENDASLYVAFLDATASPPIKIDVLYNLVSGLQVLCLTSTSTSISTSTSRLIYIFST